MPDLNELVGTLEKSVAGIDALAAKTVEVEKKAEANDLRVKGLEDEIAKLKSVPIITSERSTKALDEEVKKQFREMLIRSKAVNEGTTTEGGYVVPEELAGRILDSVERYGFCRRYGNAFPMKKDKLNVPSLSGITASVVAEGTEISVQTPTFGRVQFDSKKLAALIPVSNEWLADADISVVNKIIELMGVALATREDQMAFTANGEAANGSLTGLIYNTSTASVTLGSGETTFASVTWDDISDMIDSITTPVNAQSQLRFFAHKSIRSILRKLAATSEYGSPFKASGGEVETLWGYPISWLNIMPSTNLSTQTSTPFMLFGDPYYLGYGARKDIEVMTDSSRYFEYYQTAMRATERFDAQCLDVNAWCRLVTAAA